LNQSSAEKNFQKKPLMSVINHYLHFMKIGIGKTAIMKLSEL